MNKDIYFYWAHWVAALLRENIECHKHLEAEQKSGNPGYIALAERQLATSLGEYKDALKEWVRCVLRYDQKHPLIQMHQESISLLLPTFDWQKERA